MRRFGYGNGAWMDAIMMGRLREDWAPDGRRRTRLSARPTKV